MNIMFNNQMKTTNDDIINQETQKAEYNLGDARKIIKDVEIKNPKSSLNIGLGELAEGNKDRYTTKTNLYKRIISRLHLISLFNVMAYILLFAGVLNITGVFSHKATQVALYGVLGLTLVMIFATNNFASSVSSFLNAEFQTLINANLILRWLGASVTLIIVATSIKTLGQGALLNHDIMTLTSLIIGACLGLPVAFKLNKDLSNIEKIRVLLTHDTEASEANLSDVSRVKKTEQKIIRFPKSDVAVSCEPEEDGVVTRTKKL